MYRKLSRESRIRRSMLAGITKDVIMNEGVTTTEARAKEVRKFVDKMITYGKDGSLVARRKALAFLHNDKDVVNKVFNELAPRYAKRNGGYTTILKVAERKGDNSLMVILKLVEEAKKEEKKEEKPKKETKTKKEDKPKKEKKTTKKKETKKEDK